MGSVVPAIAHVDAFAGVGETGGVAGEHFDVGEQMVRQQDGLRVLHVGETGHDRALVFVGLLHQRGLKRADLLHQVVDLVAQIQPDVERDLVVAAAGGVNTRALGAERFGQRRLDVHVDVFQLDLELHFAFGDPAFQDGKLAADGVGGFLRNDPGRAEHGGMRHAAGDVVLVEAFVVGDGLGEVLNAALSLFGESAAPESHAEPRDVEQKSVSG